MPTAEVRNRDAALRRDAHRVLIDTFLDECVDCGNEDPMVLQFDHTLGPRSEYPNSRGHGRSPLGMLGGGRGALLAELLKCEVRCANCHQRRHKEENMEGDVSWT